MSQIGPHPPGAVSHEYYLTLLLILVSMTHQVDTANWKRGPSTKSHTAPAGAFVLFSEHPISPAHTVLPIGQVPVETSLMFFAQFLGAAAIVLVGANVLDNQLVQRHLRAPWVRLESCHVG